MLWKFHHSEGFLTEMQPTDSRGLRLAMESGYTFVNRGICGFEQISYILPGVEICEQIAQV